MVAASASTNGQSRAVQQEMRLVCVREREKHRQRAGERESVENLRTAMTTAAYSVVCIANLLRATLAVSRILCSFVQFSVTRFSLSLGALASAFRLRWRPDERFSAEKRISLSLTLFSPLSRVFLLQVVAKIN